MGYNIIPWHRNCEMCNLERAEARNEEMAQQIRELAEWNAEHDESKTVDEWIDWLQNQLTGDVSPFEDYG